MGRGPGEPERVARFEAFYREQFRHIAAYVRRRVPADDAADVLARTFTVAWRRFDHVPAAPHDRLWLYGVARHTVADHVRAARRRGRLHARLRHEASAPGPGPQARDELGDVVSGAIASLASKDREVLGLLLWDELTQAEAAVVLGCSVNAVEIRFRRARRRVRDALVAAHGEHPAAEPVDAEPAVAEPAVAEPAVAVRTPAPAPRRRSIQP